MADDDLATLGPAAGPRTTSTDQPADGPEHPQPGPGTAAAAGPAARWLPRLVIAGLVLAALNLRPAITSLGALLEEVREGLGMSGTVAGLLTSVPALCFAAFGIAAPRLARRWGPALSSAPAWSRSPWASRCARTPAAPAASSPPARSPWPVSRSAMS
ncbi:hypothetical protein Srufu_060690 [Streptomyces libani subsp. rufus]|nr:hypothetical protein Srufu_060690 [Streptomyces libani subsp. rufus]